MRRHRLLKPLGWVLLLGLWSSGAVADQEPHENIVAAGTGYVATEAQAAHGSAFDIKVSPGRLDSRLRLRRCEEGLEAFLGPGNRLAGSSTVGVRCQGPVNWVVYLPVQIEVSGEVVVLARALPRGSVLQPEYLKLQRQDVGNLSAGYLSDIDAVSDMVLRRAKTAGTVLTPRMVEAPRLVRRGQRVLLQVEGESVAVRMEGEALSDGSHGETVRVRNLSSERVIDGVVVSQGVVGVSM
jgi:flagella basal body P-ring formation protein FlgA